MRTLGVRVKIIVYVVDLIARVGDWFITRYANRLGGEE